MDNLTKEVLNKNEKLRFIHNKIDKVENWELLSKNPMVTVCVATYNHENYICECLDGILMQQVSFDYEIIIKEDFSTDKTREIVIEYQKKHPNKIRLWLCKENLYSQKLKPRLDYFARGKYIARCEGDDYWTDPLKLQKQVSFLEKNPEYSLVCGGYKRIDVNTQQEKIILNDVGNAPDNTSQGFDITIERFLTHNQWLTKTLTLVYRRYSSNYFKNYKYTRDVHLNYHLLKRGKGYYMKEVFGVYHIHEGGVFSSLKKDSLLNTHYLVYKDLLNQNKNDKHLRNKVKKYLKKNIINKAYKNNNNMNKNSMNLELLSYSNSLSEFISNLKLVAKTYI